MSALDRYDFARAGVDPDGATDSDDALALLFSDEHADSLLYVAEWGCWLRWDGARWQRDTTLVVFDLVRAMCRRLAARAPGEQGRKMRSAATVSAVERLARADRRHARRGEDFDKDPLALNTPGGVVDLRTGRLRPPSPGELHTAITSVAPGGDCPRWRYFLDQVLNDDAELVAYIQRWAGYLLTGLTREHAFLLLLGPGGNGKSLLVSALAHALGDYSAVLPMEALMQAAHDRHPTDLAMLRGARLALATETEARRALAEAKLKQLTGGDKIAARFMRADFFQYTPAFKIVMVGNHRPTVRNPDEAMRRRLHMLPMTFRPEHPDPHLAAALRAEAPGILAWAIEGCLAWQREGLGKPQAVAEATAAYFEEQDLLAQWLTERCEPDRRETAAVSALFRDWTSWAQARGEQGGTAKSFSAALERHYAKKHTEKGRVFVGLRLKPSEVGAW